MLSDEDSSTILISRHIDHTQVKLDKKEHGGDYGEFSIVKVILSGAFKIKAIKDMLNTCITIWEGGGDSSCLQWQCGFWAITSNKDFYSLNERYGASI